MTINGITYNLIDELKSKAFDDAEYRRPPQSCNPVYIEEYDFWMKENGSYHATVSDFPLCDYPAYVAEFNKEKERIREEWQIETANKYGFDTWDELMEWEYSNDSDMRV